MAPATDHSTSINYPETPDARPHGSYTTAALAPRDVHIRNVRSPLPLLSPLPLHAPQFEKRQGPIDQNLPYPPPPYTPTIPLHASIVPYTTPSIPTSLSAPNTASRPMSADSHGHSTNIGALIGAIIASVTLLVFAAGAARLFVKRKAGKIKSSEAGVRFSMFIPHGKSTAWKRATALWSGIGTTAHRQQPHVNFGNGSEQGGQFVFVSTSDDDMKARAGKETGREKRGVEETPPLEVLGRIGSVFRDGAGYDSPQRRHSSPAVLADFTRAAALPTTMPVPSKHKRQLSLPPLNTNTNTSASLQIQRQKAAELAQMLRMQIVKGSTVDASSSLSACSSRRSSAVSEKPRSVTMTHGLGIVHEEDENVDIARTAMTALQEYSVTVNPTSSTVPITELFQVDREGRVVCVALGRDQSCDDEQAYCESPTSDGMPATPTHGMEDLCSARSTSDTDSETEESCGDDLKCAVVMRVPPTRSLSMSYKRPVLISVRTSTSLAPITSSSPSPSPSLSPSPSRQTSLHFLPSPPSAPSSIHANMHANASTSTISASASTSISASAFPSPPPMLSPILVSQTSFSDDITNSLEERVFAYRDAGPWSKEQYRLTTPGQVRALVEALALTRPSPHFVDQREKAWPWPPYEVDG